MANPTDGRASITRYRGVLITHHEPIVLRDDAGQEFASVEFSFTVGGMPMMAETIEIAWQMIDSALGQVN